ncbi:hypothetical protein TRAPUB_169 [Trametes pubescens]|uniref:Uncharacterized protein n=1 Tax=Trametes pubescens TaxID=154538 RepID=A0A1M2VMY4_TRAPU|nr:hypothetical protein TRAPUB_169 [Trametes pubescens]
MARWDQPGGGRRVRGMRARRKRVYCEDADVTARQQVGAGGGHAARTEDHRAHAAGDAGTTYEGTGVRASAKA